MPKYTNIYITTDDFAYLQGVGRPYEGFVIGLGYAYVLSDNIPPPNQNGFSHCDNIPIQFNRYTLLRNQFIDNSPEMIERSVSGIAPNGAKFHFVEQNETLTSIARRYKVSVDDLVRWNKIKNPDKIDIKQRLIVSEGSQDLLGDYLAGRGHIQEYIGGVGVFTPSPKSNINAKDIISALSIAAGTHGFLPKTQLYNQIHARGQFAYVKNGEIIARSNNYIGNQYQSSKTVSGLKTSFNNTINFNRRVAVGGLNLNAIALGMDVYNVYQGNVNEFTTTDIGVGTVAVTSGAASYFTGITIPYVGEFVLLYGSARFGWDMGERYGPSKWPQMYRDYKKRKASERLLELIIEDIERNKENE